MVLAPLAVPRVVLLELLGRLGVLEAVGERHVLGPLVGTRAHLHPVARAANLGEHLVQRSVAQHRPLPHQLHVQVALALVLQELLQVLGHLRVVERYRAVVAVLALAVGARLPEGAVALELEAVHLEP